MVEAHGRAQLLRFEVVAEQRQRHRVPGAVGDARSEAAKDGLNAG